MIEVGKNTDPAVTEDIREKTSRAAAAGWGSGGVGGGLGTRWR